jgi:TonB family protein
VHVIAGGEILLEVEVDFAGRVARMTTLRATPPFTDLVKEAVGQWSFEPVGAEAGQAPSRVLVAAVYRPPILGSGPTPGILPRDENPPSRAVPFPVRVVTPLYPANALGDGQVLIEVKVATDGSVAAANVVDAEGPFGDIALEAAREWRFRPAEIEGQPVATLVYVIFAFRSPVAVRRPPDDR